MGCIVHPRATRSLPHHAQPALPRIRLAALAPPRPGARRRMAARLIRILVAALLALAILLVGGVGLALLAFNPDAFKSVLITSVQLRYHRRLELPGTLRLRLFPPFTLQTGPMRLSEADDRTPFAQAADMRLHLDPLALLRRRFVVDGIAFDAPHLELRRDANGHWNFADLLSAPGGKMPALDIHQLSVQGGDIVLRDQARGLDGRLSEVDGSASGIGRGGWHPLTLRGRAVLASPSATAGFDLQGQLHADSATGLSLRNLLLRSDSRMAGDAHLLSNLRAQLHWSAGPTPSLLIQDLRLRAQGRARDGKPLQLQLEEPLLEWRGNRVHAAALRGQALLGAAPRTLHVELRASAGDGPDDNLQLPELRLQFSRAAPQALSLALQLGAHLNLRAGDVRIDALQAHATWGTPPRAGQWQAQGKGSYSGDKGLRLQLQGDHQGSPLRLELRHDATGWQIQARAGALDLGPLPDAKTWARIGAWLRELPPASLSLQADSLHWGSLRLSQLQVQAHDNASDLVLDSLQGQAWGGTLQAHGSAALDARRATLQADLDKVSMSSLLDDLVGHAALRGSATLNTELTWRAPTATTPRSTDGSVTLTMGKGELQGVDLRAPGRSMAHASTTFSALDARAAVAQGVATLAALQLREGSGNWSGSGSVDALGRVLRLRLAPVPATGSTRPPRMPEQLLIGGSASQPSYRWTSAQIAQSPK